jgi:hypothetical protein
MNLSMRSARRRGAPCRSMMAARLYPSPKVQGARRLRRTHHPLAQRRRMVRPEVGSRYLHNLQQSWATAAGEPRMVITKRSF